MFDTQSEKRSHPRYGARLAATVRLVPTDATAAGTVLDLSADGLRLQSETPLQAGQTVGVRIPARGERWALEALLQVRWVRGAEAGLSIRGMTPRSRARLRLLLEDLAAGGGDEGATAVSVPALP